MTEEGGDKCHNNKTQDMTWTCLSFGVIADGTYGKPGA
jgi:hypothetical protein